MMTKVMVERGLDTELDDRLGYDKYGTSSVIPPLLMSVKSRRVINYSNFLGGTPPIAE